MTYLIYLLSGLLIIHGVVCLLGTFFPFYPPVVLFYWFFPGHFAIRLIIVLLVGASQIVYGAYLLLKKRRQISLHWLALTVVVFTGLLLIFPAFHGLFTGMHGGGEIHPIPTLTPPVYPTTGEEAPDDIILTPDGPAYRANVHQEGVENPWPPIQTTEAVLGSGLDIAHVRYRAYIETNPGEARNNIFIVRTPGRDIDKVNLMVVDIPPSGIDPCHAMEWHCPGTIARVLIIEVSQDVEPGEYTFEIGVDIDGKDYGEVPCTIKVIPETTPTPVPQPIPQQPTKPFLEIISVTSPVRPLTNATLVAQSDTGAECSITIDYGPSGVQCLHPKIADGSGRVSWTWTVGNFRGKWEIVVKASYGGETAYRSTFFTVQ